MKIHIYENHISGGIYTNDEFDERFLDYCEACGDSDRYIGCIETLGELVDILTEKNPEEDGGDYLGYNIDYIKDVFNDAVEYQERFGGKE